MHPHSPYYGPGPNGSGSHSSMVAPGNGWMLPGGPSFITPGGWMTHSDPLYPFAVPTSVNHTVNTFGANGRGGAALSGQHHSRGGAHRQGPRTPAGPTHAPRNQPLVPTENLFICYLPSSVDDLKLHRMVSQHGMVRSAKVMLDLNTKLSRGFGFALMASVDDAAKAKEGLDGLSVDGKRLQVRFADPPASDRPDAPGAPNAASAAVPSGAGEGGVNLYVKGIPLHWTDHNLCEYFASFGAVMSAVVLMDGKESKGIGLVRFDDAQVVANVLQAAPLRVDGWPQPITVRYSRAQPSCSTSTVERPQGQHQRQMHDTHQSRLVHHSPDGHGFSPAAHQSTCRDEQSESSISTPHAVDACSTSGAAMTTSSQGSAVDQPAKACYGPFGLLMHMHNPYCRALGSGTATPDGGTGTPQRAAQRASYDAPPISSPRSNFAPLPQTVRNSSRPLPPSTYNGHSCQYCQLGTTIRVWNTPEDHAQLEQWVDRQISGFGAVSAKEVCLDGSALITFVDPGAAHMAMQLLAPSGYQPQLYDCSAGYGR